MGLGKKYLGPPQPTKIFSNSEQRTLLPCIALRDGHAEKCERWKVRMQHLHVPLYTEGWYLLEYMSHEILKEDVLKML